MDGGAGDDVVQGGDGDDVLIGGDGDDDFDGGDGDDVAFLGDGDDDFVWNPGDDNDVVEGQSGTDGLRFTGANGAETVDITANGGRVRLSRDVASVLMDLNDLEEVTFRALGGADRVTVGDVSGTDLTGVTTDLRGADGQPDGGADEVRVQGTNGDDVVQVMRSGAQQTVVGLTARVSVAGAETGLDRLMVNGVGGADVVEASTLPASMPIVADGGADDDVLIGGAGDDALSGGAGDDVLIGGLGQDVLDGGAGDNVLLGGETIIGGRALSRKWLAQNARTVDGNTEIDLGRKRLVVRGIPLDALQRTVG